MAGIDDRVASLPIHKSPDSDEVLEYYSQISPWYIKKLCEHSAMSLKSLAMIISVMYNPSLAKPNKEKISKRKLSTMILSICEFELERKRLAKLR